MVYIVLNKTDNEIWFCSLDYEKAKEVFDCNVRDNEWGTFELISQKII